MREFPLILGCRPKKKGSSPRNKREIPLKLWGRPKKVFIAKPAKKQFLLTNSGVMTSILGVSDLELLQGHRACYFLWGTIRVWMAQAVIWGARPRNATLWRWA